MSDLTPALKEAYAVAPTTSVILHTLELRHPEFIDDEGNATAVRVVRDTQNLTATLENGAPLNSGEDVTFIGLGFDFQLPATRENELPRLTLTLDAVAREVVVHLEAALVNPVPVDVTYRPYMSDDLTGPGMDPPLTLQLTNVTVDAFQITGLCVFDDILNRRFPNSVYDMRFPTLFGA
jgi:hypothetical protein